MLSFSAVHRPGHLTSANGKLSPMTYLELPNLPLLTPTEEVQLARRIEAGVYADHLLGTTCPKWAEQCELVAVRADGEAAWQRFFTANLKMAALIAYRWARHYGVDADDILQECCLALGQAIRAWDYQRGTRFSTLAWPRLTFTAQHACHKQPGPPPGPALRLVPEGEHDADSIWLDMRGLDPVGRAVIEARFGFTTGTPISYHRLAQNLATSPYFVKRIEKQALSTLASISLRRAA